MTICKKKKCVWRNDVGGGKNYCFKQNCPYSITINTEKSLTVKWLGLVNKSSLYYDRNPLSERSR